MLVDQALKQSAVQFDKLQKQFSLCAMKSFDGLKTVTKLLKTSTTLQGILALIMHSYHWSWILVWQQALVGKHILAILV